MTSPIVIAGADDLVMQHAQAMAEQQAIRQLEIEEFLKDTSSRIYAQLICKPLLQTDDINAALPILRTNARKANVAAMVLAESRGMVRLQGAPNGSPPAVEHPK